MTSAGRRPYRSATRPNRRAPIGRIAKVTTIATVTSVIAVPNSAAIACTTNTRRKKSNASNVQPRKLAITALRCAGVQGDRGAPSPALWAGKAGTTVSVAIDEAF